MLDIPLSYLVVFFSSLIMSLVLMKPMVLLSRKWNIVDHPNARKIHDKATPCMGGVGIFLAFQSVVIGSLLALFLLRKGGIAGGIFPNIFQQIPLLYDVSPKLFSLIGASFAIVVVGFLDDKIGVKFDYRLKFLLEGLVALWMVLVGIRLDIFSSGLLNSVISIFWIVGITNAFNLLDNMDGLSGGVAYICSMLFFFIAARQDQYFVALTFLTLAGSLLGFLYFNFHPAKIFLGDTGALFVGFLISVLTISQSFMTPASTGYFPVFMPLIILSLPIFDTSRVVIIRFFERRPLFQGDKRHISHRLVELGMSQRQAVFTVYVMTFTLGVGCIVLDSADRFTNWIILLQAFSIICVLTMLMAFANPRKKDEPSRS